MGTPKRKFSQSRRDKRAAHWKVDVPNLEECPNCHQPKLPHRVCPNCGQYRGRRVINFEE